MKRARQEGHAALIAVTVILAIAILGLLGWALWRNLFNKPAATPAATTTSNTKPAVASTDLTQSITATYGGKTLTIKYPASWQNVNDGTNGSGITSPDGNIIIHYSLEASGGIGGSCGDGTDSITDPVQYATWEAVPSDSGIIFASYIEHYIGTTTGTTNYYRYGFGAMRNSDAIKNVKTGDSACPVYGFASYIVLSDASNIALQVWTVFKNLYNTELTDQRTDTTLKEVQDTITSADAQTAQKIIESLTIK